MGGVDGGKRYSHSSIFFLKNNSHVSIGVTSLCFSNISTKANIT